MLTAMLALVATLGAGRSCPIAAATALHSQHGRLGVYQGRRIGSEIALRQIALSPQADSVVVENFVVIRDRDHFTITSRLSNDRGRTWQALSRWEYRRKSS